MKKKMADFSASDYQPLLSSDYLGCSGMKVSQWDRIPPARMYDASQLSKHVIVIHGTAEPLLLQFFDGRYPREKKVTTGDVQIFPAGEKWSCQWTRPLSFVKLELDPLFLDQVAEESGFGHADKKKLDLRFLFRDDKLVVLIRWMLEEVQNGGQSGKLYNHSLANMAAVHLLRHYTGYTQSRVDTFATNKHVTTMIAYMQANLEAGISLADLSMVSNISLSQLVRLFKKHTGVTPHQYLIQLRIERAKQLIRCGNLSGKEIAVQAGFSDQAHFTKLFKRMTGMSPLKYAAHSRKDGTMLDPKHQ
ncbi:AraC family transcriptional regulator [Brevibacillus sp. AG162]|uniref:helix-turn-helix domain-containing protein n=1 Tax=Brevibacillus sp. AG162 TaxID=2572910 RepID=UPI001175A7CD|nr:AraC family transcriptional regulator [Brevibacillus sp. AG162]TQK63752.1 AraC family transcriptional regulator [Brevibacillus sp. AG162]